MYSITTELHQKLRSHRRFYVFEGWLMIAIGILAVVVPMATAVAVNVIIAIALLAGGISRLLTWRRERIDSLMNMLSGVLLSLAGLAMLVFPSQGIAVFVMLLGIVLLVEGALGIAAAFSLSSGMYSGWLLISGGLSTLLGLIVLTMFPEAGVFYLAIVVGMSFIMSGASLLLVVRDSEVKHDSA